MYSSSRVLVGNREIYGVVSEYHRTAHMRTQQYKQYINFVPTIYIVGKRGRWTDKMYHEILSSYACDTKTRKLCCRWLQILLLR